ncbi:tyrosine-type recombinase/integrase [Leptolyngbya sp. FACHB-541]|uniref:tyrosine-type recombinase/integrase n=1 Tax=Leptolyngbya sp. FACHB-541 TaxID=2692810 RepID=UPI0032208066
MATNLVKTAASSPFIQIVDRDIMEELLRDKRSPNTRRTYAKGLAMFFQHIANQEPSPQLIEQFLKLERFTAIQLVLGYKAHLMEQGKAESTVNTRISAVKALVKYAQKIGKCSWSLEEVQSEKVTSYRDTTGIESDAFKRLFEIPDRSTLKGKRDYALLRLLWDNVLRRNEICAADTGDFDPDTRSLSILGKGKGTQKEKISISSLGSEAIADWLEARQERSPYEPRSPLFIAVDRAHFGHRLTGDGLYYLVRYEFAEKAGIKKIFSPHRCRHSGITAALDQSDGNVRSVQKLSRHSNLDTLLKYDDNRKNAQGEMTDLLAGLI